MKFNDMECPYCGAGQKVNHDDGTGYAEDEIHEHQCTECDKYFVFNTSIIYCYSPEPADCLNDGKHDYKKTIGFPEEFSEMECTMCGDRRELTEEERKTFGIGTKEEYFAKLCQKS